MKDCELFNVCSTEIRSVGISISSIICVYFVINNNGGIKRMRKEVISGAPSRAKRAWDRAPYS